MKTLIFNGSPRKKGDSVSLINEVIKDLKGEYKIVNAYFDDISPCIDCRHCWKKSGCSINDEMQAVYDYVEECDNVLIVSPIYFAELTGPLLSVTSRFQTYFTAGRFRNEEGVKKPKKGAVILVGGGHGNINIPYGTAKSIFHHINAFDIHPLVCSHDTNNVHPVDDEKAMEGIKSIVKFLNRE